MKPAHLISTILCLTIAAPATLWAQDTRPSTRPSTRQVAPRVNPALTRNAEALRNAWKRSIERAAAATVLVKAGNRNAALGTIVDPAGYILTKASELNGPLRVRLRSGREFPAEIVGVVTRNDLAMIKIDIPDALPTVTWGDADAIQVGEFVATTGLAPVPISVGVVSTPKRRIQGEYGMLGVMLEDGEGGALVARVLPDGAALKAGIEQGDVILSVNGVSVGNREELVENLRQTEPGDTITVKLRRKEQELELSVQLGRNANERSARARIQNNMGGALSVRAFGFEVAIQHDSVLRPEECGGPLVNLDGSVIGINISRAGRVESYALPSDLLQRLIPDLKAGKFPATTQPSAPPATQPTNAPATRPETSSPQR